MARAGAGRRPGRTLAGALAALLLLAPAAHAQGLVPPPVPLLRPPPAPAAAAVQPVDRGPGRVAPVAFGDERAVPEPQRQAQRDLGTPLPLLRDLETRPLPTPRATDGLRAGEVVVPVNKSQVLRVDQPFAEVSVGNPEVADVVPLTQRSIYVFGKQLGSTNLTLINEDGGVLAVVDLLVSFDLEGLKGRLFDLLPDARVEVRPAGDAIALSGEVASAEQLARVLAVAERYAPGRVTNLLSVTGSQQVMLQVRFAEVERSTVKQLGLSSRFVGEFGGTAFSLDTGDGVSVDPRSFATGVLSVITGTYSLDVLFDALEEKGVVKTLAEPNLIALSGDTASFLAGGEFPIPVAQDSDAGGVTVTIEFKPFGVSLSFTPTVIGRDLVNLVLVTEVSAIDPNVSIVADNLVIPGLQVRRAKTTVELRDGQGFAIAGLLQDDFQDQVRQFPLLGDIPILGTLFRSTSFQRNQTELVVIVTPRLVQPVDPATLTTPADLFIPPSAFELFLLGRTEGYRAPQAGAAAADDPAAAMARRASAGIVGPYGYILE